MGLNRIVLERIAKLGMTNDTAARLSGVSTTKLSQFSRGARDLDPDGMQALCQIVSEAQALVNDFPDHPFDWRAVGRIRDLLDSRREAIRVDQNEEGVNIALGESGDLFAARRDNGKGTPEIRVVRFPRNAAYVDRVTAGMLVTALHNTGYNSARIVVNNNPGLATLEKFGKLWFTESERSMLDEQPIAAV